MKKFTTFALCTALVCFAALFLTACGRSNSEDDDWVNVWRISYGTTTLTSRYHVSHTPFEHVGFEEITRQFFWHGVNSVGLGAQELNRDGSIPSSSPYHNISPGEVFYAHDGGSLWVRATFLGVEKNILQIRYVDSRKIQIRSSDGSIQTVTHDNFVILYFTSGD